MSSDDSNHHGLFEPVRRLLQLVAQTFHVRAGLFALELREEGEHLLRLLALGAVFLFLGMAALLAVSFGVVAWFWDDPSARRVAVATVAAVYLVAAAAAGIAFRRLLSTDRLPFEATLREFEKDRDSIRNGGGNGRASAPSETLSDS